MKTAVSIPDAVFQEADRLAKRLQVSRSELYARALRQYVATHADDPVTESMDRVADAVDTRSDGFVAGAGRRVLGTEPW